MRHPAEATKRFPPGRMVSRFTYRAASITLEGIALSVPRGWTMRQVKAMRHPAEATKRFPPRSMRKSPDEHRFAAWRSLVWGSRSTHSRSGRCRSRSGFLPRAGAWGTYARPLPACRSLLLLGSCAFALGGSPKMLRARGGLKSCSEEAFSIFRRLQRSRRLIIFSWRCGSLAKERSFHVSSFIARGPLALTR